MLESQLGKAAQTKPSTPPPALPLQLEPAGLKRKKESKGKEVVEVGKNHPSQEEEAQKATKQVKMGQKGAKRRSELEAAPLVWLPTPMLDGAPLLANASIRDF